MNEVDGVELRNTLRNAAEMTWTFFNALVEQGFKRGEALVLTSEWLRCTLRSPAAPEE